MIEQMINSEQNQIAVCVPGQPYTIYCTRFEALMGEIDAFLFVVTSNNNVSRKATIKELLCRLKAYAKKQYDFFLEGFYKRQSLNLAEKNEPDGYTKEYVFGRLIRQISVDLTIIKRAYNTRAHGSAEEKAALQTADALATQALQPAIGLIDKNTTVLSYFQKTALVRVIPYAPVAIIGVPLTCVDQDNNFRDFLAIPHEIGHYVYWHGRLKKPAQSGAVDGSEPTVSVENGATDDRISRSLYQQMETQILALSAIEIDADEVTGLQKLDPSPTNLVDDEVPDVKIRDEELSEVDFSPLLRKLGIISALSTARPTDLGALERKLDGLRREVMVQAAITCLRRHEQEETNARIRRILHHYLDFYRALFDPSLEENRFSKIEPLIEEYSLEHCIGLHDLSPSETLRAIVHCRQFAPVPFAQLLSLFIQENKDEIQDVLHGMEIIDCINDEMGSELDDNNLAEILIQAGRCMLASSNSNVDLIRECIVSEDVQTFVQGRSEGFLTVEQFVQTGKMGIQNAVENSGIEITLEINSILKDLEGLENEILATGRRILKDYLAKWLEEIFSDVYGCLVAGPVMAQKMQELLFDNYTLIEDDGEHPIPVVRPYIYSHTLQKLQIDTTALVLAWEEKMSGRNVDMTNPLPNRDESAIELRAILETLVDALINILLECRVLVTEDEDNMLATNLPMWSVTASSNYTNFKQTMPQLRGQIVEVDSQWVSSQFHFDRLYTEWKAGRITEEIPYKEGDDESVEFGWNRLISKSGWNINGPEEDGNPP